MSTTMTHEVPTRRARDWSALVSAILPGLHGEPSRGQSFAYELPRELLAAITWPVTERGQTNVAERLYENLAPRFSRRLPDIMSNVTMTGGVLEVPEVSLTTGAGPHIAGAAKTEAAMTFSGTTRRAGNVATWISLSESLLEDASGLEAWLRVFLAHLVTLEEEKQLLSDGTGTAVIQGFFTTDLVPTYTTASTKIAEILGGMIAAIAAKGVKPDTIVMSPTNAGKLLGEGHEFALGAGEYYGELEKISSPYLTDAQYLVGAVQELSVIGRAGGIVVEGTRSHASDFIENKAALRASSRIALGVLYRDAFLVKRV